MCVQLKSSLSDLAVFGGAPAFEQPLHVGRPNIGDRSRLRARFEEILDSRWLTNAGRQVQEFEERIAVLSGTRHCIAVCNGTIALELVIRALGMTGEVIVPSFTFVATAHALQWQQIRPVFCDVDEKTHNISPDCVEKLITPETTGIIGVHLWGRACDTEALDVIARRHRLAVLYDASHAVACSHGGKMIGGFGDAEVFSFHATKFVNSFEGGAILTSNDELAKKVRLMKNFGFAGYDNVIGIGTNGKMSEISAAMGITSLESLDDFISRNRANYQLYRERLSRIGGLRLIEYDNRERQNFQYIVAEIDDRCGLSRDQLVKVLHAENIYARRYFYPGCHLMEPYRTLYPGAGKELPVTEKLTHRVIAFPTGTAVGAAEIEGICGVISCAVHHAKTVAEKLG